MSSEGANQSLDALEKRLGYAFHDRDGFISEAALRAISKGLRTPLADLFGTVTFYHHLAREAPGQSAPRVCTGPICCLRGGKELLDSLQSEGAIPMPCAGRCDDVFHLKFAGIITTRQYFRDQPANA